MSLPGSDDQTLNCIGCKNDFVFTMGEQAFYERNSFAPPKRCKPCRDAKKAAQNGGASPAPAASAPGAYNSTGGYNAHGTPFPDDQGDGGGRNKKSRKKGRNDDWGDY